MTIWIHCTRRLWNFNLGHWEEDLGLILTGHVRSHGRGTQCYDLLDGLSSQFTIIHLCTTTFLSLTLILLSSIAPRYGFVIIHPVLKHHRRLEGVFEQERNHFAVNLGDSLIQHIQMSFFSKWSRGSRRGHGHRPNIVWQERKRKIIIFSVHFNANSDTFNQLA